MSAREEQANAVMQVFSTGQKLTGRELQILRENAQLLEGHDAKTDYYLFRMQIELIDAIRALDETSAKLVTKTNWLTLVILGLTGVLVIIGVLQIVIMVRHS